MSVQNDIYENHKSLLPTKLNYFTVLNSERLANSIKVSTEHLCPTVWRYQNNFINNSMWVFVSSVFMLQLSYTSSI